MIRHARLIKVGLDSNPIHASKLIADYAFFPSSHSLTQAYRIFDQVPCQLKDTALWASLISACTRSNHTQQALRLFSLMHRQSQFGGAIPRPNSFVFTSVARAIASAPEQLFSGEILHAHVIKFGALPEDVFVGTALLDMYAKCGYVHCALKVFDEMGDKNVVTWNAMISGFHQNGIASNGLELFVKMKDCDFCLPDEFTVATVLSCCASTQNLVLGKQVHGYSISTGFELDCLNSIANMYCYCGEFGSAEIAFDGLGDDAFMNLIKIRGFVVNHAYENALMCVVCCGSGLDLFLRDRSIIVALLTTCSKLSFLKVGKQLHGLFVTLTDHCYGANLTEEDTAFIGCALVDMYSKCGDIVSARLIFDFSLPSHVLYWNSMMSGYIHKGLIKEARELFEVIPQKNVISWTGMMTGYVQNEMPDEALNLMKRMHYTAEGIAEKGNCLSFVVGLEASSHLTDLERGKQIHGRIVRWLGGTVGTNVMVGTALVYMYSRTGKLQYAHRVFDLMAEKNVVSWTSIITGCAAHGLYLEALEVFQQMINAGIKPNEVTFIAVLTTCSHCGLVDEGLHYFKMMTKKYTLIPGNDHYTCLIDMLGRFGRVDEAWLLLEEVEETIGGSSIDGAWASLLGACHSQGNVELGERIAKKILKHKKQISATNIALSNIYSAAGMWLEAFQVRESSKKEEHINLEPGLSRICMHPYNS